MSIQYNSKRKHDSFYKNEDQFSNPKEYFKECGSLLLKEFSKSNLKTIDFLDIGCAAGDFLRYLSSISEDKFEINYCGSDVMSELLIEAKNRFAKGYYEYADLSNQSEELSAIFKRKFDFISMLGVHSIFDELFWLDNVINSLKNGGKAIVYGIFNPYPYDLIMRVRKSSDSHLEPGWNVHSKKTIIEHCKSRGVSCDFRDFEPDIVLGRDGNDSLRAWNILLDENKKENDSSSSALIFEKNLKRIFTNATRIIHDYAFCLISK